MLNSTPFRWIGKYNEDTDLCLQALAGGWCTILINAFMCDKKPTMTMKGGNTEHLYLGDGRLKMARELERRWPGIVQTKRRFGRPQHVVKHAWKKFDTQLKLRPGVNLREIAAFDESLLKVIQVKDSVKNESIRNLLKGEEADL